MQRADKIILKGHFYMSQIEQLKELQEKQRVQKNNLTLFQSLICVNVGVQPTQHFPKLKDDFGNKVKDESGKDKRSENPDGWTYTFSEFGSGKTIKVVVAEQLELELLTAYKVSGLGYDIKSANMIFIDTRGRIDNY